MLKQIKRNPVTKIAGSIFIRTIQKPPQVPPKEVEIEFDSKKSINRRMLSYHIERLDSAVPQWNCAHGVRITEAEIFFQAQWKRKYHTPKEPPISFECIECHPVCVHGLNLSNAEINSSQRFSKNCPKCVGRFTNLAGLRTYLKQQQLGQSEGMSLTEGELVTSYGLTIRKDGKNFVLGGGSKSLEHIDAVLEHGPPTTGMGKGPDNNSDNADGTHEDDLKDVEFVEEFETKQESVAEELKHDA